MAFLGVGQVIGADGAVVKVDAVEGLGERFEGLLAAVGLELTFPYGDAVPSHCGYLALLLFVALFVATDLIFPEASVGLAYSEGQSDRFL